MQEALKFSTGIITSSQGPRGLSQGTMTAKAVIRGVEKGTLVLVNGVPMNQSGMYNLQDIASDSVEKNVKSDIVLTVNNILDRDDNINHGSSHYSTVPTNFLLTYNYRL